MNVRQLHRLILQLTELAKQASLNPDESFASPGELAVLDDILEHPGSSVRQITERTGFVQSHVSTTIARLGDRGLVETTTDPTDRRRTIASPTGLLLRTIDERTGRTIDVLLAEQLGAATAERTVELLSELSRILGSPTGR
ncbi:MarR family winged helix-turn-helix transcriptional regulator [Nocardia sp. CA-290969]|uniref:MarR family winged helix-turn-helix transcriptional regulator n=1 Tax=Nocardia sp. CA-290969 TaxID=3239986 RepID=UPI003D90E5C8